ncbi:MAG: dihydrofolate reductase [Bacteroidaceae bacterium]|jgi:dihydrofolate reductase|nr:dihydrofolate reductase [Bacteroidaceae bacterium]
MAKINLIVCIARNGAIGYNNHLLYHLRDDLKHFKELTTGHTVLMGRRTFESLPKGALPNRRNIVLTKQNLYWPGTEVFSSLQDALNHCSPDEDVFIIGGHSVYRDALTLADNLFLTEVDDTPSEADTFFPKLKRENWKETAREHHEANEQNERPYDFVTLHRISK